MTMFSKRPNHVGILKLARDGLTILGCCLELVSVGPLNLI